MAKIKLPSREVGSRPSSVLDLGSIKQTYDYDYFSGANASIYFGDILVDEITSIHYSIEQGKVPIYGYSSYNWDFVAKGTTIVTGSFSINFKESAYLYVIMKYLKDAGDDGRSPMRVRKTTNNITKLNIERIVKGGASEYTMYQDLASLDDQAFEDIAETFEDQVWGAGDATIREKRQAEEYGQSSRGITHAEQFDIHLTFGHIDDEGVNHTTQKITGVELIGSSKLVEISGEPIQESYNFIARDVF